MILDLSEYFERKGKFGSFYEDLQQFFQMPESKSRTSELHGNIADFLYRLSEDDDMAGRYFYWDSRLWKAIRKHIATEKLCKLIEREPFPILNSSAYYGLNFRKVFRYVMEPYVGFVFSVSYYDENEDREFSREYTLPVPLDLVGLEYNCSDAQFTKRFNRWMDERYASIQQEQEKQDLPTLEALLKKYPKQARELIRNKK
jgi:hypothetical protein